MFGLLKEVGLKDIRIPEPRAKKLLNKSKQFELKLSKLKIVL